MLIFVAAVVAVATVILVVAAAWRRRPPAARREAGGIQEFTVRVNGGYVPPRFRARAGVPLRLHFVQDEDIDCPDRVFIPDFGIERRLRPHGTTVVEFVPLRPGNALFTCRDGFYVGQVLVREARRLRWPWRERTPAGAGALTGSVQGSVEGSWNGPRERR